MDISDVWRAYGKSMGGASSDDAEFGSPDTGLVAGLTGEGLAGLLGEHGLLPPECPGGG